MQNLVKEDIVTIKIPSLKGPRGWVYLCELEGDSVVVEEHHKVLSEKQLEEILKFLRKVNR